MSQPQSLIRRLSQMGTRFATFLCGIEVGCDAFGNRYYHARRTRQGQRQKRWVIYNGEPEASTIPPEWHIWIHHLANSPLPESDKLRKPCSRPFLPDHAGMATAWLPAWHLLKGGRGTPTAESYKAWKPEQ